MMSRLSSRKCASSAFLPSIVSISPPVPIRTRPSTPVTVRDARGSRPIPFAERVGLPPVFAAGAPEKRPIAAHVIHFVRDPSPRPLHAPRPRQVRDLERAAAAGRFSLVTVPIRTRPDWRPCPAVPTQRGRLPRARRGRGGRRRPAQWTVAVCERIGPARSGD